MRCLPALVPALLLAAACSAAAPAEATTVRVEASATEDRFGDEAQEATVIVRAQPGERNRLRAKTLGRGDPVGVVIRDAAGVRPLGGCRRRSRRAVLCPTERFLNLSLQVALGDRADRANLKDAFVNAELTVRGGAGDDRIGTTVGGLDGGPGRDVLRAHNGAGVGFVGGPGNDHMRGAGGRDVFSAGPSRDGRDTISGGRDRDEADYSQRSGDVRVDLDGRRDDGARGERDRIRRDVESLTGGTGDDVLTGSARENFLVPGLGSDVVRARGGRDFVGDDPLPEGDAGDRLDGGPGPDTVKGGSGSDTITGGPGRDVIRAAGGDDGVDLRDDGFDDVDCGEGADAVALDGFDFFINSDPAQRPGAPGGFDEFSFSRGFAGPCEEVQRDVPAGAVARVINAGFVSTEDDIAVVSLGCPGDGPSPCAGSARLDVSGRRGTPVSFSIARDDVGTVKLALDERTVAQRKLARAKLVVETLQPGGGVSRLVYPTEA